MKLKGERKVADSRTKRTNKEGPHWPLVGWARDEFPIYALIGHATTDELHELRSSWRLKSGNRPTRNGAPYGYYDGTFVADYEYVRGIDDLDECNGTQVITPANNRHCRIAWSTVIASVIFNLQS